MKISIAAPATPIPPVGWGAVESLIWDYKVNLERLAMKVDIININNPKEIIKRINDFQPDFVHIQYDDWIVLYPYIQYPCACTTHFAYLEQPQKMMLTVEYSDSFKMLNQMYSVSQIVLKKPILYLVVFLMIGCLLSLTELISPSSVIQIIQNSLIVASI